MLLFGKLWCYALCLLCQSEELVVVALLNHLFEYLLMDVIEKPHMRTLYKNSVRKENALQRKLRKEAKVVQERIKRKLASSIASIRNR